MDEILITYVIPVYNAERYLRETVESIQHQGIDNYEIILVDDGSNDNSFSIMKELMNSDKRITIRHIENHGAPYARNIGIDLAKGKYLILFDSDDVLVDGVVCKLVKEISDHDADLLIASFDTCDKDLNRVFREKKDFSVWKESSEEYDNELQRYYLDSPFPGNKIYVNAIVKSNNIHFDNVRVGQDLNFYLKYLAHTKSIVSSPLVMAKYRQLDTGISHKYDNRILDIVRSIDLAENSYSSSKIARKTYLSSVRYKNYIIQFCKCRYLQKDRKDISQIFIREIRNTEKKGSLSLDMKSRIRYKASYLKTRFTIWQKSKITGAGK